jgi:hypothetical protein
MAMLLGASQATAETRELPRSNVRTHHAAGAKGQQVGPAKAKAGAAGVKAGAVKAGGQRPATVGEAKKLGRAGAKPGVRAKKRQRLPEVDDSPVAIYRTGGHAARSVSPATKAVAIPAGPRAWQAPVAAASSDTKTQGAASDFGGSAGAAQGGVFASGQSRPDDDERLPPPQRAVKPATPTAVVQSNDSMAAAKQLATVGQRLSASSDEAADATPQGGGDVEAQGQVAAGARLQPSTAAEVAALKDLKTSSHEEMAEEAMQPVVLLGLYRNGRLLVPAPLKGTHEILVHQNLMADEEGLERIRDEEELDRLRASHQLVELRESEALRVNPELAGNRRCARAWSVRFAEDMGRAFYARFRQPLQVNSAVRTVAYQIRLQRTNGNAAPVEGDVASPHLTGQALDFGKRGMSVEEISWMRAYLLPLIQAGKVDVEEEFQQACFHISVYRAYLPNLPNLPAKRRGAAPMEVAQLHNPRGAKVAGTRADEER